MWTAKTKCLFFCWLSFYFTWSEFLHQYQNRYILAVSFINKKLKILVYVDADIYTDIIWEFSQAMTQNEYPKREKSGNFPVLSLFVYSFLVIAWENSQTILIHFRKLSFILRTFLVNLKCFPTTWWKIKKRARWVINNYKASYVGSK